SGNVSFGGGNETGLLTAGSLALNGNFAQTTSATSFVASGTHTTGFMSEGSQSASFANPGTSRIANVLFNQGTQTALTDSYATSDSHALRGNASFCGGASGLLTAGAVQFMGNLTFSAVGYNASFSGTNTARFTGASPQTVTGTGGAPTFKHVVFSGAGGVDFA